MAKLTSFRLMLPLVSILMGAYGLDWFPGLGKDVANIPSLRGPVDEKPSAWPWSFLETSPSFFNANLTWMPPLYDGSFCEISGLETTEELEKIANYNRKRVLDTINMYNRLKDLPNKGKLRQDWKVIEKEAIDLCDFEPNHPVENANNAMKAWSVLITRGDECCSSADPPFCASRHKGKHYIPLIVAIVFCVGVLYSPLCCTASLKAPSLIGTRQDIHELGRQEQDKECPHTMQNLREVTDSGAERHKDQVNQLSGVLNGVWDDSTLSDLPHAQEFRDTTCKLFVELTRRFGFQIDNAKNQFEHIISLWRSNLSMVADSLFYNDVKCDGTLQEKDAQVFREQEETLLREGLLGLHADLLAGLYTWRKKNNLTPSHGTEDRNQTKDEDLLNEIIMFLLVWGEAGNLRFMPEVICYITDLALRARAPSAGTNMFANTWVSGTPGRRYHPFLVHIVRPIYHAIFEENYCDMLSKGKKESRKLKDTHEKFMPEDCMNYDDWNELFYDIQHLHTCLHRLTGDPLSVPLEERFEQLPNVNWKFSLNKAGKTHREVHSVWAFFAASHRVWFLHAILYGLVMWYVAAPKTPHEDRGLEVRLAGSSKSVSFASVCLLVPVHAVCWKIARWTVCGQAVRPSCSNCEKLRHKLLSSLWQFALFAAPIATYAWVRYNEGAGQTTGFAVFIHCLISILGAGVILLWCWETDDMKFDMTPVPKRMKIMRGCFWLCVILVKIIVGYVGVSTMSTAANDLKITRPGDESINDFMKFCFNPRWDKDMIQWVALFSTGFVMFCGDTQFWFVVGCTFLGCGAAFNQRMKGARHRIPTEDIIAKIPHRFSDKVFTYAARSQRHATANDLRDGRSKPGDYWTKDVANEFRPTWKEIVARMREEDKLSNSEKDKLTGTGRLEGMPDAFEYHMTSFQIICRQSQQKKMPENKEEVMWRITALARAMSMNMPRPFRLPFTPGVTVMIPHYGETIILSKAELWKDRTKEKNFAGRGQSEIMKVVEFLKYRYEEEWHALVERLSLGDRNWKEFSDDEWEHIRRWASMRMQTLWRTVKGMNMYYDALKHHFRCQGEVRTRLRFSNRKSPAGSVSTDIFCCLLTMQMYPTFDAAKFKETNQMLDTQLDDCNALRIAFIDYDEVGDDAGRKLFTFDHIHLQQDRRYFSRLIDKTCLCSREPGKTLRRVPRLSLELPGYPILGDGKGDNQNHAVPFSRGSIIQCIDANQGAYFEQMLLLPCVLGEFRQDPHYDRGVEHKGSMARRIVGFPEHITSDIGSIGDFAAGAEMAFGTTLQRSYSLLGSRMHYGHPDMMNKTFIIQQGGVSKATKTVNLSEDIFAGMDFTLRGDRRNIKHAEYFHVSKGRDLGFNTVLGFFAKLSSGTGEQVLTRQMFRLGQVMGLGEFLGFYYAHGGFYVTQHLLARSVPLLTFVWLLTVVDEQQGETDKSRVMAEMLARAYSCLIIVFIMAQTAPLLAEVWLQFGTCAAIARVCKQMLTLAPMHFIFQAKVIGIYVTDEIRYGGAKYVETGRGLPTDRRHFLKFTPNREKGYAVRKIEDPTFTNRKLEFWSVTENSREKRWKAQIKEQVKDQKGEPIPSKYLLTEITDTENGNRLTDAELKLNVAQNSWEDETGHFAGGVHQYFKWTTRAEDASVTAYTQQQNESGVWDGIYTDWSQIAFYDGTRLLLALILALCCNGWRPEAGWALLWWFVALGMTIMSWLWAPFLFNPGQFAHYTKETPNLKPHPRGDPTIKTVASYYSDDCKDWWVFFFDNNGRHWRSWNKTQRLHPGLWDRFTNTSARTPETGKLRVSLPDVVVAFFVIGCWYTVTNTKVTLLNYVLDATELKVLPLMPPMFSSLAAVLFMRCFFERVDPNDAHSHADPEVHHPSASQYALVVSFFAVVEALAPLWRFILIEWSNTFFAALLLKYSLLSYALLAVENCLRFKYVGSKGEPLDEELTELLPLGHDDDETTPIERRMTAIAKRDRDWAKLTALEKSEKRDEWMKQNNPCQFALREILERWVQGHRMAWDLLVSALLLISFKPFVTYDSCFGGCLGTRIHDLIIYRDTGGARSLQRNAPPPATEQDGEEPPVEELAEEREMREQAAGSAMSLMVAIGGEGGIMREMVQSEQDHALARAIDASEKASKAAVGSASVSEVDHAQTSSSSMQAEQGGTGLLAGDN